MYNINHINHVNSAHCKGKREKGIITRYQNILRVLGNKRKII